MVFPRISRNAQIYIPTSRAFRICAFYSSMLRTQTHPGSRAKGETAERKCRKGRSRSRMHEAWAGTARKLWRRKSKDRWHKLGSGTWREGWKATSWRTFWALEKICIFSQGVVGELKNEVAKFCIPKTPLPLG